MGVTTGRPSSTGSRRWCCAGFGRRPTAPRASCARASPRRLQGQQDTGARSAARCCSGCTRGTSRAPFSRIIGRTRQARCRRSFCPATSARAALWPPSAAVARSPSPLLPQLPGRHHRPTSGRGPWRRRQRHRLSSSPPRPPRASSLNE